MLEIELCRICLADSIRMYPIKHTRYHEVFGWRTEDTLDMNDELPYSVCYLCNPVLNRLYDFLKNMIDTEIHLKEILRTSSQLTYESVEKLKSEISKPHNLSKICLRNSNFIALDVYKGHRPPREFRRYFDKPPIMIEYHKPYEHMKLKDIIEEQEPEEINEKEPEETEAEAENVERMEVETEQIREAKSAKINDKDIPRDKSKLLDPEPKSPHRVQKKLSEHTKETSSENENQQKPPNEKNKKQPEHIDEDSETIADEYVNDDDENILIDEDIMKLVYSPEIENEPPIIPTLEIYDKPFIENDNRSEQINHKFESNKQTKSPDSIDAFLLCAKKYRPPKKIDKSSNENVTKEDLNPYLQFTERHIEIEKVPQEKLKTPEPVKYHNPYLQFIEEHNPTEETPLEKGVKTPEPVQCLQFIEQRFNIPTEEEPPKKRHNTSEQIVKIKTPEPKKYQNQNLQLIEHIPVKETEPEQTSEQIDIDKSIHTNTPVQQKSTELTAVELEEKYYNLYLDSVKETPFKISNEPIVIEKFTPDSSKSVSNLIKSTKANEPNKIIVTSEPKKYIQSYVDFVREYGSVEKTKISELEKESSIEIVPIPPKNVRKRNITKKSSKNQVLITPVQENPSRNIDSEISGHYYFDHQKEYHRPSILKKTGHRDRNKREIKELANKIKNRAAILRKEILKTDINAEKAVEENAVTKLALNDGDQPPGISEIHENLPNHSPLKSKEHSDKLLIEIPLKLSHDIKNKKIGHVVVDYHGKSKHTDKVSDKPKDQNQGDHYNDQVTPKESNQKTDQNDGIVYDRMWSDQDDNTVDSQVDRALKVLDESLKDEDLDPKLPKEDNQEHIMPNDQNNHTLTEKNDTSLQLKDVCIIIEDKLEDNNKPKDQNDPYLVVQDVFTLKDQGLEDENLISKDQYDQIIMLANQDDQVMEDGNVAVKIESVDEEFQGSFEENNEEIENVVSDSETFNNDVIIDITNGNDDMIQHSDIKTEVEENMQIDDEVSENELYLQERCTLNENTTHSDKAGTSNYENPDFESNYNEIQSLNEQEHYTIRNICQISVMPCVQLERLLIGRIKETKTEKNYSEDDKYSCPQCDFKTTVGKLMSRHRNIHDTNKQFVCNVCQHRFLSHYHLSRHQVIHDRTKYYCAYCDFKTNKKLTMDKHQNIHNQSKRFVCYRCKKRFRSASHRLRHSCTKKNVHKCNVCDKLFKCEANYLRHIDQHDRVVPIDYECNVCGKSFDSEKEYINHYQQHKRKNLRRCIICKQCKKKIWDRTHYNKHIKLHETYAEKELRGTEDKQETYNTDDEMELNEKENKKEDEMFVCGLCPNSFDTEIELGKHAIDHIL